MQYRYEVKFPIRKDKIHLVDIWINNQIFIKKHYSIYIDGNQFTFLHQLDINKSIKIYV